MPCSLTTLCDDRRSQTMLTEEVDEGLVLLGRIMGWDMIDLTYTSLLENRAGAVRWDGKPLKGAPKVRDLDDEVSSCDRTFRIPLFVHSISIYISLPSPLAPARHPIEEERLSSGLGIQLVETLTWSKSRWDHEAMVCSSHGERTVRTNFRWHPHPTALVEGSLRFLKGKDDAVSHAYRGGCLCVVLCISSRTQVAPLLFKPGGMFCR